MNDKSHIPWKTHLGGGPAPSQPQLAKAQPPPAPWGAATWGRQPGGVTPASLRAKGWLPKAAPSRRSWAALMGLKAAQGAPFHTG